MATMLMYWGISAITDIQRIFQGCSSCMVFLSLVGDPKFVFTIFFPVAYSLHRTVGIRVVWAAVISEWLNAVLKWVLHGERPYWWVFQPGLYPDGNIPHLRQFSITCETGPGSPSGHAMITSAVWYILVSDFLHYRQVQSVAARWLCWGLYLLFMCAVSLSRLFIAAHFPHQVIAGVLAGIALGQLMDSLSISALRPFHYMAVSAGLTFLAWATYALLHALGINPQWSLALALKHCAFREWVHLDTSLFYALVRDLASLIGLGVGLWFLSGKPAGSLAPRSRVMIAVQVVLALSVSMIADSYNPAHDNVLLFYTLAFVKHCVTVTCIVAGTSFLFDKNGS